MDLIRRAWARLCWHRWMYGDATRECCKCGRYQVMEHDVGGWTAGQWNDAPKPPTK